MAAQTRSEALSLLLAFLALTAVVTYPQLAGFSTSVPYHRDAYFSMWRLAWVAHTLVRDPLHLFDGNIYYPEHGTLAYSDALLLPATVLAPLFWLGAGPITVYNVAIFAALTLSGYTAFLLGRELTGNRTAGVVAGVIFAFAPYRFDHYMHLELQMVFWLPLALLAAHRLVARPTLRQGLVLGATIAAQALSSMYAGIFIVTYCAVFVPLLIVLNEVQSRLRLVPPLVVGAALTLAIVLPYSLAYANASETVGTRARFWLPMFSASLSHYFVAPLSNRLYGARSPWTADEELYLFPGLAAVALSGLGIVRGTGRARFAYLAGLILAFDLSRGLNGLIYPWLYQFVLPFRALRAPVRSAIFINLSMAALSAYGTVWLLGTISRRWVRQAAGTAIAAVLLIEYASSPEITRAPRPAAVDHWLSSQPPVIVMQLPMTVDFLYMYQGIGHFQKMLNGYSGFEPPSYETTRQEMASFPDDRSIAYLKQRDVDYVVVRGGHYSAADREALLSKIQGRADLIAIIQFREGASDDRVFAVQKADPR